MANYLLSHSDVVILGCWVITAISTVLLLWPVYDNWKHNRRFRRQMAISAYLQGRYSVLDSYVRSGGGVSELEQEIQKQLQEEYNRQAEKNGAEYLNEYARGVKDARADVSRLKTRVSVHQWELKR